MAKKIESLREWTARRVRETQESKQNLLAFKARQAKAISGGPESKKFDLVVKIDHNSLNAELLAAFSK